jgi:hypothetical protein
MKEQDRKSSGAHMLLTHLLNVPEIADHLQLVHEIALDPSCEVLLGPEEKRAMLNVRELATRLEMVTEADRDEWKQLI